MFLEEKKKHLGLSLQLSSWGIDTKASILFKTYM